MTEFTLDTSGAVRREETADHPSNVTRWPDLSPFEQGYVGAMFAELRDGSTFAAEALKKMSPDLREQKKALGERCHWSRHAAWQSRCDQMVLLSLVAVVARAAGDTVTEPTREGRKVLSLLVGFSDLAPETLAAIRKDCAARRQVANEWTTDTFTNGGGFWSMRQMGYLADFPPLTVSLSDAGKVVFS